MIETPHQPSAELHSIGTYVRLVSTPLDRVFENAYDWEHLPWLHAQDFASISLHESGPWGWRAQIGLRPDSRGTLDLELLVNREHSCWVSRPCGGESMGEVWTYAKASSPTETRLEISFHVPVKLLPAKEILFEQYQALYRRLWNQDEEMAWLRERRSSRPPSAATELDLGSVKSVRASLPLQVEFGGRPFRLVDLDGELVVHSATCPHWLGPLQNASVVDGCVTCPWHGYRFDIRTGENVEGRKLKLAKAPAVIIEDHRVLLRSTD